MRRLTIFALATLSMVGCAYLLFQPNQQQTGLDESSTANAEQLQSLHAQNGEMTVADALDYLRNNDKEQTEKLMKQAQIIKELRYENARLKAGHDDDCDLDSTILTTDEQKIGFYGTVDGVKELQLLYRGSRNGWTGPQFHNLADGQGETLAVMKTSTGNIMGGYTDISWEGTVPETRLPGHRKSFLFHYENDGSFRKFMFDGRTSNIEILNCNRMLTWWEWGIMIYANPQVNGGSGSYLNSRNFEVPEELNGNAANYYVNDGVSKIQLVELELYKVIR